MPATLTILRFNDHKLSALAAMGLLPSRLNGKPGLKFHKLLGSGKGSAFSFMPDLGRYFLLCQWEQEAASRQFFEHDPAWLEYSCKAAAVCHLHLAAFSSRGSWQGKNPFEEQGEPVSAKEPLAVLTRASINKRKLLQFWRHSITSTDTLDKSAGMIFSAGIGELPYVEQATFSIWESTEKMMAFVRQPAHIKAMELRKKQQWYREELFARFRIISVEASRPELFPEFTSLLRKSD